MNDIEIELDNRPGALASLGETLGKHQVSIEGGAVFSIGQKAIAHFLVDDPGNATLVLEQANIKVIRINEVVIQKLKQDMPGQLGLICRRMADAGVNILTQYSDHSNQLILVVDNLEAGKKVSEQWIKEW